MGNNIVNYVFVHNREIKELFIQESERANSNVLKYCKFLCSRNPELSDFTDDDDVISVYDEKYQKLNGILRMHTGIMLMLDNPQKFFEPYDVIGFQRCTMVYDFPVMRDMTKFENDKIYLWSTPKQMTRKDWMLSWGMGWWHDEVRQSIIPVFNQIETMVGVDNEVKNFVNWFMHCDDTRFFFTVGMFLNKGMLPKIKYIYEKSLSTWTKLVQIVNEIDVQRGVKSEFMGSMDSFDMIQEYYYCTFIGMQNIYTDGLQNLFQFKDGKYHCRGR